MRTIATIVGLSCLLGASSQARAGTFRPTNAVTALTDVGAIAVVTVVDVGPSPLIDCGTRVSLDVVEVVAWYWSEFESTVTFDVPYTWVEMEPPRAQVSEHSEDLALGRTYLVFFESGDWTLSPISSNLAAVYEIEQDSGFVRCSGQDSYIFGIDALGLRCSTTDQQYGLPLTLDEAVYAIHRVRARDSVYAVEPDHATPRMAAPQDLSSVNLCSPSYDGAPL